MNATPPFGTDAAAAAAPAPELSRDRLVRETWLTWANLVTAVRVAAALACFVTAALTGGEGWNFAGLVLYWLLDIADGGIARALRQETRIGAQFDILSDRLLIGAFYANYLRGHPGMAIPIAMHLLQFVVLDQYLSHQFMRWPCLSPNYFYEVDRAVWTWNWSPIGKVANGALVTGAILVAAWAGWSWIVPALVSAAVISVKVWSTVRLARLPAPEDWLAERGGR
jgi:CDP-diacylglycerol--glycerol-3-phosphate 3-phosphatidyltransferase